MKLRVNISQIHFEEDEALDVCERKQLENGLDNSLHFYDFIQLLCLVTFMMFRVIAVFSSVIVFVSFTFRLSSVQSVNDGLSGGKSWK